MYVFHPPFALPLLPSDDRPQGVKNGAAISVSIPGANEKSPSRDVSSGGGGAAVSLPLPWCRPASALEAEEAAIQARSLPTPARIKDPTDPFGTVAFPTPEEGRRSSPRVGQRALPPPPSSPSPTSSVWTLRGKGKTDAAPLADEPLGEEGGKEVVAGVGRTERETSSSSSSSSLSWWDTALRTRYRLYSAHTMASPPILPFLAAHDLHGVSLFMDPVILRLWLPPERRRDASVLPSSPHAHSHTHTKKKKSKTTDEWVGAASFDVSLLSHYVLSFQLHSGGMSLTPPVLHRALTREEYHILHDPLRDRSVLLAVVQEPVVFPIAIADVPGDATIQCTVTQYAVGHHDAVEEEGWGSEEASRSAAPVARRTAANVSTASPAEAMEMRRSSSSSSSFSSVSASSSHTERHAEEEEEEARLYAGRRGTPERAPSPPVPLRSWYAVMSLFEPSSGRRAVGCCGYPFHLVRPPTRKKKKKKKNASSSSCVTRLRPFAGERVVLADDKDLLRRRWEGRLLPSIPWLDAMTESHLQRCRAEEDGRRDQNTYRQQEEEKKKKKKKVVQERSARTPPHTSADAAHDGHRGSRSRSRSSPRHSTASHSPNHEEEEEEEEEGGVLWVFHPVPTASFPIVCLDEPMRRVAMLATPTGGGRMGAEPSTASGSISTPSLAVQTEYRWCCRHVPSVDVGKGEGVVVQPPPHHHPPQSSGTVHVDREEKTWDGVGHYWCPYPDYGAQRWAEEGDGGGAVPPSPTAPSSDREAASLSRSSGVTAVSLPGNGSVPPSSSVSSSSGSGAGGASVSLILGPSEADTPTARGGDGLNGYERQAAALFAASIYLFLGDTTAVPGPRERQRLSELLRCMPVYPLPITTVWSGEGGGEGGHHRPSPPALSSAGSRSPTRVGGVQGGGGGGGGDVLPPSTTTTTSTTTSVVWMRPDDVALLWRYRYFITRDGRYFLLFLSSVVWARSMTAAEVHLLPPPTASSSGVPAGSGAWGGPVPSAAQRAAERILPAWTNVLTIRDILACLSPAFQGVSVIRSFGIDSWCHASSLVAMGERGERASRDGHTQTSSRFAISSEGEKENEKKRKNGGGFGDPQEKETRSAPHEAVYRRGSHGFFSHSSPMAEMVCLYALPLLHCTRYDSVHGRELARFLVSACCGGSGRADGQKGGGGGGAIHTPAKKSGETETSSRNDTGGGSGGGCWPLCADIYWGCKVERTLEEKERKARWKRQGVVRVPPPQGGDGTSRGGAAAEETTRSETVAWTGPFEWLYEHLCASLFVNAPSFLLLLEQQENFMLRLDMLAVLLSSGGWSRTEKIRRGKWWLEGTKGGRLSVGAGGGFASLFSSPEGGGPSSSVGVGVGGTAPLGRMEDDGGSGDAPQHPHHRTPSPLGMQKKEKNEEEEEHWFLRPDGWYSGGGALPRPSPPPSSWLQRAIVRMRRERQRVFQHHVLQSSPFYRTAAVQDETETKKKKEKENEEKENEKAHRGSVPPPPSRRRSPPSREMEDDTTKKRDSPPCDTARYRRIEVAVTSPSHPHHVLRNVLPDAFYVFKSSKQPISVSFVVEEEEVAVEKEDDLHQKERGKHAMQQHRSSSPPPPSLTLMFKTNDDTRQDAVVLSLLRIMDHLLRQEGLDLCLTPYRIQPTSPTTGLIEVVPHVTTLESIKHDIMGYWRAHCLATSTLPVEGHRPLCVSAGTTAAAAAVAAAGKEWRRRPPPSTTDGVHDSSVLDRRRTTWKRIKERYSKSLAGYSVVTYLLGVGDRHLENILMATDGRLLHIDFGFIFGNDPKPFAPPMKLGKEMMAVMGGEKSAAWQRFLTYCCRAYHILRQHASLLLYVLCAFSDAESMPQVTATVPRSTPQASGRGGGGGTSSSIPVGSREDGSAEGGTEEQRIPTRVAASLQMLQERLRLDLSNAEATQFMLKVISDSTASRVAQLMDFFHSAAQATKN